MRYVHISSETQLRSRQIHGSCQVAPLTDFRHSRSRRHAVALVLAFAVALCGAVFAHAETPQALLQKNKCNLCHSERESKTGPAYVDIAAKYQGKDDAVESVAALVRKGAHGSGPWHMPPHPEISRTDAVTMSRYILSLRR